MNIFGSNFGLINRKKLMRKSIFKLLFLFLLLFLSRKTYSCGVAPSFSSNASHTCGLPYIIKAYNTSGGTGNSAAKYWWKINGKLSSDTIVGMDSIQFLLKSAGNHKIRLYVKDTSGCIDSSSQSTISVSSNASPILDQNYNYTLSPTWMNCLQFVTDPDSFRVELQSNDTMNSAKIFWGDGDSDTSIGTWNPGVVKSHRFNALGIFTIKIVSTNGSCVDTVYGTVYNQRQPTAGIIGPTSGSNRGCVPHTMRIVNNSYNISDNTFFIVDWGNGETMTLPYTSYKDTLTHVYKKGVCSGVIKITATNVCGSSFTTWNPIDISEKDKALWSVTKSCNPTQDHIFYNNSTDKYCLTPDVKEYFWDFGDGTTVGWTTSKTAQYHKYNSEGDYFVTLIAKSACGNDTFRDKVSVYYLPKAQFAFDNNVSCKPLSSHLVDTSKGRGISRLWTVIEGSNVFTSTDSILDYTFTVPGNNIVKLKITNPCGSDSMVRTFRVNDKPRASFANISGSCVPVTVSFNNTTVSDFSVQSYLWDFGDSTTSNQKNPASKVYTVPGNYTIRLIVTDTCGIDTFEQTFTAYGMPQAILSGDTVGCTFDSLSFNNQSTNSTSYQWTFGDNTSATTTSTGITKHVYATTGSFQVRLISGTGAGCKDTTYHNLYIKPGAKAQFNIDKTYGCAPTTFKFSNSSVYAQDYRWYANGKLVSTNALPNDTTLATDTNLIRMKLVVTSSSSCQGDSLERVFFTSQNPKAIIPNKDSGCGPLTVNFGNQSLRAISYSWKLGNGQTSTNKFPTAKYGQAYVKDTIYKVSLKVSNWLGCKDSTESTVLVFPSPTSMFEMSEVEGCGPLTVNFTNLSMTNNKKPFSTLKHSWRFDNGSTTADTDPSATFTASEYNDTLYSIKLKVTSINGCANSSVQTVTVHPQPKVAFTPDKISGCAVLPVTFTNQSSPRDTGNIDMMSFNWTSSNGALATTKDFTSSYGASLYGDTTYKVKLVAYTEHGCYDSTEMSIVVHPQPIADFDLDKLAACTPMQVSTINRSVSKDGGPLTHAWNFDNAYQSSQENDSTIYINNSNVDLIKTVTYTAISQYGCRDTAQKSITVYPKPIAIFDVSTNKACAPMKLGVTDKSINAQSYYWGTDDNLQSGAANSTLVLPGINLFDTMYVIRHVVVSPKGCVSDTVYKQVIAMGKPKANFLLYKDSTCAKENIQFVNASLGAYKYNWKFGDNKSSTQVNPKHKFPVISGSGRDSIFNITLEASSVAGCKDTFKSPIYLVNRPLDNIVLDKKIGCTDLEVNMSHASKTYKTLYWDLGDNSSFETTDSVNHIYVNPLGNLTMQPKISLYRARYNCLDTASAFILVYPKPIAEFKTQRNDPCDAGNYQFINKSKNNVSNQWLFNDGTVVNVSSFSTVLPPSEVKDTFYSVKLLVTNNYKCVDSSEQVIKVKPKMKIDFVKNTEVSCEMGVVNFTNKSTGSVRYFWKFGDGGLSNEVNPSYVYNKFGLYYIKLYGYDKDGCVDSSSNNSIFRVLEKPKANFEYLPFNPKLPNAVVDFVAKPTILSANVNDLVYDWNFGDNSYPTSNYNIKDPQHTYTQSGNFEVTLTVWNKTCSDVIRRPVFVEDPKPEVSFSADSVLGCAGMKVKFKNTTQNAYSYRWIWGDGSPDSYEFEPTHTFEFSGKWDVTLIATGTGGTTTYTIPYMVTVYPRPDADFFTYKQALNLPNAVFAMQNMSNNAIKYNWSVYDTFGNKIDGSTYRDPSFYINEEGRFSVSLVAINSYGCSDTMYKQTYLTTFKEGYVYAANAFSPNGNGKNDDFKPSVYNVKQENYVFRIYNRWGEMVFETTDLTEAWDGTHNGEACEQDVYVWTVSGMFINSDTFALRGTVTLLK